MLDRILFTLTSVAVCLHGEELNSWMSYHYVNISSNLTLTCPGDKQKCSIVCSESFSCAYSTIDCGSAEECYVVCDDEFSCRETVLNGSTTNLLVIAMSHDTRGDAAPRSKIICPENGAPDSCILSCLANCNRINIYAVNGS